MVTPQKAKKILEDGSVHGKPLTKKQKGFFGAQLSALKRKKVAAMTASNNQGATTQSTVPSSRDLRGKSMQELLHGKS